MNQVIVWVRDTTGQESGELPPHVAVRVLKTEHGLTTIRITYALVPAHDTLIHTHVHESSGFIHEHAHAHLPETLERAP